PTIVAYLANAWALARSSAVLVTIYIYTQPAIAGLLAWLQLGVGITARLLASAALIAVGVAVVSTRRPVREALGSTLPRRASASSRPAPPRLAHDRRKPFGTPKNVPAAARTSCSFAPASRIGRSSPARRLVAKPKMPDSGALHSRSGRVASHA